MGVVQSMGKEQTRLYPMMDKMKISGIHRAHISIKVIRSKIKKRIHMEGFIEISRSC